MIGIYKITNLINGKVYIGQSTNIKRRWKDHKKDAFWKSGPDYDYPLYRSMRKYGLDNFSFEVLEECSKDELNEKEKFYIAKYDSYKNGYNQTEGGDSVTHNLKLTDNEVLRIIQRLKTTHDNLYVIAKDFNVGATTIHYINKGEAYRQNNEYYPIRQHLAKLNAVKPTCPICGSNVYRKNHLCRTCANTASQKVIRPQPLELAKMIKEKGFEETGKQFGVSGKTISKWCKNYQIPCHKHELVLWYNKQMCEPEVDSVKKTREDYMKPVKQIDMSTGKIINTFKSIAEAGHYLGKSNGNRISNVCNGYSKSAYGYYWEFAEK